MEKLQENTEEGRRAETVKLTTQLCPVIRPEHLFISGRIYIRLWLWR